ncbi:MAG: 2-phospho-L-lactate transferase, partial [Actinomycetota bacterium]|nr:2-phospho-L-lactate transferase [Actinomycetota bacterium]
QHPRVVAVTPIVNGRAFKGPADRLLARLTDEASASQVARLYATLCDVFVVDASDGEETEKISALDMKVVATNTVMADAEASTRLATEVLASCTA